MKKLITLITVFIVFAVVTVPVSAQTSPPHVIRSTKPMSDTLRGWLDDWLAVDAPSDAPYYIVTNWREVNGIYRVSLAGIISDAEWNLEDSGTQTIWLGSVRVTNDGTVELATPIANNPGMKRAAPSLAPGGGSYVAFPFQAGTAMIYGPRAIHGEGDYGTSGLRAVDLVSGDDLGSGAAPPYVYASDNGTIDYVCSDGTSVAVRTYNATTGDYFIYAHLEDNENLVEDATFTRGALIGSLVYGTFDDDCGWAEQQEDHYHLHWMFAPANGAYQAEGCILNIASKKWTCGTEVIGTGGWLKGGGGTGTGNGVGTGLDDVTGSSGISADKSFWDMFVLGVLGIFKNSILRVMPEHQDFQFVNTIQNSIRAFVEIYRVLQHGTVNLSYLILVMVYGVFMYMLMFVIWIVAALFKAWKSLVPIFGA